MEQSLLEPEVRTSSEKLDALLHQNFKEFGSSGKEYSKKDVLDRLPTSEPSKYEVSDFHTELLANNIALSTFKTERIDPDGSVVISLRSSIWKHENGKWQMIYHQGTPTIE